MKRFFNIKTFALMLALLLGTIAVHATERVFAANGKGIANMIDDGSGVPAADVSGSGNATHLGLFIPPVSALVTFVSMVERVALPMLPASPAT